MKIRTQFTFLAITIIAVPFLCSLYVGIHFYKRSSNSLILKGYKEISKITSEEITQNEWEIIVSELKVLPKDIQSTVFSGSSTVIWSTIPEYPTNSKISKSDFWDTIHETSNDFFYQFTTIKTSSKRFSLVTRIPRQKNNLKKRYNIFNQLQIIIYILVFIAVLTLIFVSRNIFKSIMFIQKKTEQIAQGNLSVSDNSVNQNKDYQNEIISISENLDKMKSSLLEAQNKKNIFFMGLSHDLKTPVAIIKGYTEAITDGVINEETEINKALKLISVKTNQLEEMINNLINFTKLNSNELREKFTIEPIDLIINEFAKDAVITGKLFKRRIETNIAIPENTLISLDKALVFRAFENLFSNAIRYSKDDDLIKIDSFIQGSDLIFKISDTGIGIEKKDLNNIFDLMFRGTNSRREEGMGIGLSVVKNIISIHRWSISVESEKYKGSTFTITIPLDHN